MSAEEIAKRVRPITEERALESYKDLKDLPCAKNQIFNVKAAKR